jgi:hypothetical protein
VIVAVLWFIRLGRVAVPKPLLLFAALLACTFFLVGYSTRSLTGKRIAIARFSDDSLGADSRIFRENIESRLRNISESRVARVSKSYRSLSELKKRFPNSRRQDVVIAGSLDSLLVYFPSGRSSLVRKDIDLIKERIGYEVIFHPPAIIVGNPKEPGTAAFVSDLVAAYSLKPDGFGNYSEHQELLYVGAAHTEARWKSQVHRALPAWLLGNAALVRAFSSSQAQLAELDCAIKWYGYAASLFKPIDNPELAGAIYNNWGVAVALRAWLKGRSDDIRQAMLLFKRGQKTQTFPASAGLPLRSWQSARSNLQLLSREQSPQETLSSAQKREERFWNKRQLEKSDVQK